MENQRQIAEDWLKYAIVNWRKNLDIRKIRHSGDLFDSFNGDVISSGDGNRLKLEIAYTWYGQMVDMGVGRGTKAFDVRDQASERRLLGKEGAYGHGRRQKKWFRTRGRDGIAYQLLRLSELLGENIANTSIKKDMFGTDQKFVIVI